MPTDARAREIVVARVRPHGRALFWPTTLLIATMGAAGYFVVVLPEGWQRLAVLVVAIVIAVGGWLLPLASWLARHYTITTRRIVLRSGIVVRVRQELLHSRGQDVTVRKSALQALFGSGDVHINIGLEAPVILRDVASADLIQSALHDLMEASQASLSDRRQWDAADGR